MGLSTAGAFCSDESAPRSQVASDTGCAVAAPCFRGVRPGPWPGPGCLLRRCVGSLAGISSAVLRHRLSVPRPISRAGEDTGLCLLRARTAAAPSRGPHDRWA